MKYTFLNIGKTVDKGLSKLIDEYNARIKRFVKYEFRCLPEIKASSKLSPNELKRKESELIRKHIKISDFVVLLDEHGKMMSSVEFAHYNESLINRGVNHIVFVSGGAYGFDPILLQDYQSKLSLSKMTFTHQMIRLLFTEQLYRALTILKGLPYHNE